MLGNSRTCSMCGEPGSVPFPFCIFCKQYNVMHHGRCCPENPVNKGPPAEEQVEQPTGSYSMPTKKKETKPTEKKETMPTEKEEEQLMESGGEGDDEDGNGLESGTDEEVDMCHPTDEDLCPRRPKRPHEDEESVIPELGKDKDIANLEDLQGPPAALRTPPLQEPNNVSGKKFGGLADFCEGPPEVLCKAPIQDPNTNNVS